MAWTKVANLSSLNLVVTTQTANYTVPAGNYLVVMAAQGKTVTLPDAATCAGQQVVVVNNALGKSTTVAPRAGSGQLLGGFSTYSVTAAWALTRFTSVGTAWIVG